MRITRKIAKEMLDVLDVIREEFFKNKKVEYPFSEWEKNREKVRERLRKLPSYVEKSVDMLTMNKRVGRPKKLDLVERTMVFLMTRMLNKSNRDMELILILLKPLLKEDVSYKSIERLYSDEEVKMVLHNLFVLLLKDEDISGKLSGDGTGYSLTITKHYASNPKKRGKDYRYVFRLMDLNTGMYVGFGYSSKSERKAFDKAMEMVRELEISMDVISLDKYYSSRKVLKLFGNKTTVYVIPKKNISRIGLEWVRVIRNIIESPIKFLRQYFKRNLSESGFSSDKRRFGWVIRQKREDRQDMAMFSIALLHNIFFVRLNLS